ncbi:MAG: DUF3616 domain-containing protein [Lautropia sp.]|nr:DUF3616 domain-containing protein [Lautropia sp.]
MTAFHTSSFPCPSLINDIRRGLAAAVVIAFGTAWPSFSPPAAAQAIQPGALTGIHEPSGLKQLPDGRILVVEDEASHAFGLLTLPRDGGAPTTDTSANQRLIDSFERKLNDLEGLTMDDQGWLYAITSHADTKKGERKEAREQLVRFKLPEGVAIEQQYHDGLRDALSSAEGLKKLIKDQGASSIHLSNPDIEGLAFDPKNGQLILGFSKPLIDGKALIVTLSNPDEMFTRQASPAFSAAYLLDLQGGGIRGLDYDAANQRYLLLNEVEDASGKNRSQLWQWDGKPASAPEKITPPAFAQMKNVEAIGAVNAGQGPEYLFLSDEGNAKKQRPGQFLRIPATQLNP